MLIWQNVININLQKPVTNFRQKNTCSYCGEFPSFIAA